MATALIALSGDGERLLGAWLPKGDGYDRAFRGTSLELQRADSIAKACPASLSWDDYCDQLSDRTPVSLWWERKTVDDGATAVDVLAEEVNKAFSKPSSE